jgi:hypothetical protein
VRDDVTDAAPSPADPAAEEAARAAQLSRAAREAVRQPADPRIDRQLARMGLAPSDGEPPEAPQAPSPGRGVPPDEMGRLEAALVDAEATVGRLGRRLNALTWVVTIEGVAIALLALVVLLVR